MAERMRVAPDLLAVLRCPVCRGRLRVVGDWALACVACGRAFRIRGGVPDFRVPECYGARNLAQRPLYDAYAPLYDWLEGRLMGGVGIDELKLRSHVVDLLSVPPSGRVLEVAVGTGANLPLIRSRTSGLIVGLDISERMLAECAARLEEQGVSGVGLVLGCAERLPFGDGPFDAVLIGGGVAWYSDPSAAIREALRVVKPGSRVVILEQLTCIERAARRDLVIARAVAQGGRLAHVEYATDGAVLVLAVERRG
ncbi:MAG: hypothetical protein DRJ56_07470 [Thermoprotei archaeon]|nr:MAG: hypothetical protein DRJ56_07470 [Thermoprotei archaeon]